MGISSVWIDILEVSSATDSTGVGGETRFFIEGDSGELFA